MTENKNVLIFGEMDGPHLSSMTTQLMRVGKRLSRDLNEELHLLLLGGESISGGNEGFGYGADKVFSASDPVLKNYMTDSYLQAMAQVVEKLKPSILLFGQNDKGMDLAPRLAFRLKTGVVLDCVDLRIDSEKGFLELEKPVFGGKAHGVYMGMERFPRIASVRDGAFELPLYDESLIKDVEDLALNLDSSRIRSRFVKKEMDESLAQALKLISANVVVSGGRGLKNQKGVDLIQETADLLGGAIGGSRPAIDYGWLPHSLQVGLTGKKVHPQVYMAVGISGALQHMAGCSKSKTIVSINSDAEAPIFRMSRLGAVGDFKQILSGFNDEIKRIMAGDSV